jgi:hypothetical protein
MHAFDRAMLMAGDIEPFVGSNDARREVHATIDCLSLEPYPSPLSVSKGRTPPDARDHEHVDMQNIPVASRCFSVSHFRNGHAKVVVDDASSTGTRASLRAMIAKPVARLDVGAGLRLAARRPPRVRGRTRFALKQQGGTTLRAMQGGPQRPAAVRTQSRCARGAGRV